MISNLQFRFRHLFSGSYELLCMFAIRNPHSAFRNRRPGGTAIFTVSRLRFMKHPGWGSFPFAVKPSLSSITMDVNYNTVGSFVKENYDEVGFRICPSDFHPSGAFPNPQSLRLPDSKNIKRNWKLIFTCDWQQIVLNKSNLMRGDC